jgi:hypothetical protein
MKSAFRNPMLVSWNIRVCPVLIAALLFFFAPAIFAADDQLPQLQPAHGEIIPTFWEQYGWLIVTASVLGFIGVTALAIMFVWLPRIRPATIIPVEIQARRALEALRGRPEDDALLVQVSGILRRYLAFACGLPPGELTTREICDAVSTHPGFAAGLDSAVAHFLRQCDERKFSPIPATPNGGAVDTALTLIEKMESRRLGALRAAANPVAVPPSPPAQPPPLPPVTAPTPS